MKVLSWVPVVLGVAACVWFAASGAAAPKPVDADGFPYEVPVIVPAAGPRVPPEPYSDEAPPAVDTIHTPAEALPAVAVQ